jgi:NitT/TauT family transport system ATP-binding protein
MGKIVVRDVSRTFASGSRHGGDVHALDQVSLEIADQEIVCLVGPSGCGKSTLLNILAGFDAPTAGDVRIGDLEVRTAGPDRIVVFQTPALFPWMTVRDNIAFGPRKRGMPVRRCLEDAARYMHAVGLDDFAGHYPYQLSGGMRQRAQIARVLVNEPSVVLMDEPFGALDAQTREVMQTEVDRIWRATRPTILFITHDIWEAILLGNKIITMTAGPSAKFKTVVSVDLPHPRDAAAPEAVKMFRDLRDDIGEEVRRTLQVQGLVKGAAA